MDRAGFDDRVYQNSLRRPLDVGLSEPALDQKAVRRPDRRDAGEPGFGGFGRQQLALAIQLAGGGFDKNVPEHQTKRLTRTMKYLKELTTKYRKHTKECKQVA